MSTKEKIHECIINFIKEHKYPPTVREIGGIVGLKSNSSVSAHLTRMQIEGIVHYDEKSPRTIVVPGYTYVKIPEGMTEKQLVDMLEDIDLFRKTDEQQNKLSSKTLQKKIRKGKV